MKFFHILVTLYMLLISNFTVYAIEMWVGDTKTLDIGQISHLEYTQWTISRPDCVEFTTDPSYYSTSATIKAIQAFAGAPCVVQCNYRYLELDPVTGRYTYSRSGYKSWSIFVSDNNSGGSNPGTNTGGGNTDTAFIKLSAGSVSCKVGSWSDKISIYQFTDFNMTWSIDDSEIAVIEPCGYIGSSSTVSQVRVYGKREGTTNLWVSGNDGSLARCIIEVQPLSDGDNFSFTYGATSDNYKISYQVISVEDKTCRIKGASSTKPAELVLYSSVFDYEAVELGDFAFYRENSLKSIIIPPTIKKIGYKTFEDCSSLENIEIPENVAIIDSQAFQGCLGLKNISILSIEPPKLYASSFDDEIYETVCLKVPAQSKETYRNHEVWGRFRQIVSDSEESENGIEGICEEANDRWDVYDTRGMLVKKNWMKENLEELPSGIFIMRQGDKIIKSIVKP